MAKRSRVDVPEQSSSAAGRPHFPLQRVLERPEISADGGQTGTTVSLSPSAIQALPDAGPLSDAGPLTDAGPLIDAGPLSDAGLLPDAGPLPDAGLLPDAGPLSDAGPLCITDVIEIVDEVGIDGDHSVERRLQQKLMAHPDVRFSSLVVRRMAEGVCLQGVLEYDDSVPDIHSLVRGVAGIDMVLNQLVIRQSDSQERFPSTD